MSSTTPVVSTTRLRAEVAIVLLLSLGFSGLWAFTRFVERYFKETPIADQRTTLNSSAAANAVRYEEVFESVFQILRLVAALAPVALVFFLLGSAAIRHFGLFWSGEGARSWGFDLRWAAILTASIGLPGLAVYAVGRAIGQTVEIDTSGLPSGWWSIILLVLAAVAAGVLEETVGVAYVVTRLRQLGYSTVVILIFCAMLRASYHLYQGWPMALGNAAMGVLFTLFFLRTGRVMPLVAAHITLDLFSFVGPEVLPDSFLEWLGVA